MKNENKKELIITRVLDAPRTIVWKAWTEPNEIMKWWGPEDYTTPVAKVDLQVGGKYLYCMRSPDGKDFWSGGTFLEIIPSKKITCTDQFQNEKGEVVDPTLYGLPADFPKTSVVTINFEDQEGGNKTKLTIHYNAESEEQFKAMVDSNMEEGWSSSLEKLEQSLK